MAMLWSAWISQWKCEVHEQYEKYLNLRKKSKSNFYYDKIKRKINEFHWKVAHDLSKNYKTVI